MAYDTSYDEYGNPIYPEYQNPYTQPTPPPIAAPTAPPIYAGAPGSTYTGFDGQPGTVPTPPSGPNGPISSLDQPKWKALWAQSGQNPQVFAKGVISQLGLKGRQTDPTAINTILRAFQAVGVNATLDQRADAYHKGIMLNGQFVKLLDGNDQWMWGSGADGNASGAYSPDASVTAPFTEPFTTSAQLVNFNKAPAFNYPDFQAPTGESILKDPSFQFRLDEGRKALEGSKAAKGTLRTGGTLRDVLSLGQNLASTEYGNIFDRELARYGTNRNNAADRYRTNAQTQFVDPYVYDSQTQNTQYGREWDQFLDRKSTFYKNQDRVFDKNLAVSGQGLDAATR